MERTIPNHKDSQRGTLDLRVRRSRDGLRGALLHLLKDKSFDEISVREIAAQADVGYTTFFRHFLGKEALLDHVITIEIERLTARALPIYENSDGKGACLALCAYVDEHRPLWSALLTGGAASKVREEMLEQSRRAALGQVSTDGVPVELGTALAVVIIVELLSWWLLQPSPWPIDRVAAIMYDRIIVPSIPQTG